MGVLATLQSSSNYFLDDKIVLSNVMLFRSDVWNVLLLQKNVAVLPRYTALPIVMRSPGSCAKWNALLVLIAHLAGF